MVDLCINDLAVANAEEREKNPSKPHKLTLYVKNRNTHSLHSFR